MSQPKNRKQFRDYILERLGEPILRVNVTEDQIQSRIDDAMYIFQSNNPNATEKTWFRYTVTDTDVTNGFIKIPENIREVTEIKGLGRSNSTNISRWDNVNYGSYGNLWDIASNDIVMYYSNRLNIDLYDTIFGSYSSVNFDYNKLTNNLTLIGLKSGTKVAIQGFRDVDPTVFSEIWNDTWLKNYVTALVQYQWGWNMQKYSNVALIGGITVNGSDMMRDAQSMKEKLEEEIKNTQEPLMLVIA